MFINELRDLIHANLPCGFILQNDVATAFQGDHSGIGNACSQLAAVIQRDTLIAARMQDQRWRFHFRQQVPDIDITKYLLATYRVFVIVQLTFALGRKDAGTKQLAGHVGSSSSLFSPPVTCFPTVTSERSKLFQCTIGKINFSGQVRVGAMSKCAECRPYAA